MKLILLLTSIACLTSCTENQRAKSWGGTTEVDLPAKTKLINATWKEAELWYLYRPAREDESPEKTTFQERSGFGVMEGKVIFHEH